MTLNGILKRLLGLFYRKDSCSRLRRSARYQARYAAWVQQGLPNGLLSSFSKAYHYQKAGLTSTKKVQLIQEPGREGIVLFYSPEVGPASFSFLVDYLKTKVEELGYRLRSSDVRTISEHDKKQRIETYYLIPLPQSLPGSNVCNQLYGNITINYTRVNGQPSFIRIICNSITVAHFSTPLPFSELISRLLQPTEL
ncbi:hypothetical protein H7F15_03325 [Pontibacter sp. Tf4]|uniref:hypothetical protein n=1 Tax=Pontibacter sp. Tf4 TaxID=2761620 RepID=UPI0016249ECE|nr:hypothetical protein [Pontibacter sp. Tf4]MBB6610058.1 hypothetical protein [Pontibacter sp. Tf4]